MRPERISPQLDHGQYHDQVASLNLTSKDFMFPAIQTNIVFAQSDGVRGTEQLDKTDSQSSESDQLLQELTILCQHTWDAYGQGRLLHRLVRPFLPRTTWNEAIEVARRGGRTLPTEKGEATIMWLDIANFTELADNHPHDQVVMELNEYLDVLTQIVHHHDGDVNKYLGDGFLAIFANADNAVQAGCALQQAADEFNCRQSAQGRLSFSTRIGIDTGQVTLASLGSRDRKDWTVIGMTVIIAERIQKQTPIGQVWLSQATFARLENQSGCQVIGPVKVKGREESVFVYQKQ